MLTSSVGGCLLCSCSLACSSLSSLGTIVSIPGLFVSAEVVDADPVRFAESERSNASEGAEPRCEISSWRSRFMLGAGAPDILSWPLCVIKHAVGDWLICNRLDLIDREPWRDGPGIGIPSLGRSERNVCGTLSASESGLLLNMFIYLMVNRNNCHRFISLNSD